jgi:hypothetical protein
MRSRRWLAPLFILALASTPLRPLQAQAVVDVVLRVRVSVLNLDAAAVDSAAVYCTAASTSNPTNKVASEDTKIPLSHGGYSGNIDVKLRLTPSELGEEWLYRCGLKARSEIYGWGVAGTAEWLVAQPGGQTVLSEGILEAY